MPRTAVRRGIMGLALGLGLAGGGLLPGPSSAQTGVALSQHGDWALMSDGQPTKSVCFLVAAAKDTAPKGLTRDPALVYVSAWPKDGIRGEVSIRLGYKPKKGADSTLSVAGNAYKLFAKDDRLFVEDPTRELKLVEAMKKAAAATLQATSERGTATTDTFALTGFSEGLQALAAACP